MNSANTNGATTMYSIVKTITGNSGAIHKLYLAKDGFRRPGDSITGVGISTLRTWKTEAGARKVLAQMYPNRADVSVEAVTS
jgi:hypothetical protein